MTTPAAAFLLASLSAWWAVVPPPGAPPAPPAAGAEPPEPASATASDASDNPTAGTEPPVYAPMMPPPPPRPRRYGDQGTSELALGLGYSSRSGLLAAGGFRHFVFDGVAPGVEGTYLGGGSLFSRIGFLMGALRLVPLRAANLAVVLTGRTGRVFLGDHADGWGAGGGGGLIVFFGGSGNVGLEVGYEALRLLPASFCADLTTCVLHGPVLGLRISF